jgi:hypothetical protein
MSLLLPKGLEKFLKILEDYSNRNNLDLSEILEEYLGIAYLGGEELRYQQTPPELIPFASQGVDGVHYGYVIHAPEIPQSDYPIGELCPMDDDGVLLCGENTNIAIENLLSFQLETNDYSNEVHRDFIKELHKYKIKASKLKANRMYDKNGNGKKVKPLIPKNYKHIPTMDGIGALAPIDTFSKTKLAVYEISDINIFEKFIIYSEEAINKGLYGDALYYLKELYWNNWTENNKINIILGLLEKTYRALNREVYASINKKNIAEN